LTEYSTGECMGQPVYLSIRIYQDWMGGLYYNMMPSAIAYHHP